MTHEIGNGASETLRYSSGNSLLLRFFQSQHFTTQLCVSYLSRYCNDIGIQHYLCAKLRKFPYQDVEYFLPELVHICLNQIKESAALEELIIGYCVQSTQFALLVFWLFQAYLHNFSSQPFTPSFKVCRRMYNKLQQIVFGSPRRNQNSSEKIRENLSPAIVLSSLIWSSVAIPSLAQLVGPIAIAQGKRLSGVNDLEHISDGLSSPASSVSESIEDANKSLYQIEPNATINGKSIKSLISNEKKNQKTNNTSERSSRSLAFLTYEEQVAILKTNYFRLETQFLQALEDISHKLVTVPQPARLSTLRADLILINNDLPADINIPGMSSVIDSSHTILRVDPSESVNLNSAERVPFLMMVEVLKGHLQFNPRLRRNKVKIQMILSGQEKGRKFDLSLFAKRNRPNVAIKPSFVPIVSKDDAKTFESDEGDIGLSHNFLHDDSDSSFNSVSQSIRSKSVNQDLKSPFDNNKITHLNIVNASKISGSDLSALATHMRAAATMLAQLDASEAKRPKVEVASIKARIVAEMQSLEDLRLKQISKHDNSSIDALPPPENVGYERRGDKEDPSSVVLKEKWHDKKERIRKSSPYGHLQEWDLVSIIVKTGADLRQEAFACQLIYAFQKIWQSAKVDVWVRHINILVTGFNSGLVETITDAVSIHSLKKNLTQEWMAKNPKLSQMATLYDYFKETYGERDSKKFISAQNQFIKSLASYSVIQYLLQLKDRHNGNVLLDKEGHLIHIDFGFMLANSPGNVGFESAPFKLTSDYLDIMGERFEEFTKLFKLAFKAARKRAEDILVLVSVMQTDSNLPCFALGSQTHVILEQRFQLHLSESEIDNFCEVLIHKSNCSVWTRLYDQYQTLSQGIY